MIILLGFAFISGLVTILAPCIWPLLPIVLSSSIAGTSPSHKRPLGVTLGIMLSFAFFTLSISYLVSIFQFDPNNLRLIAVVVISLLGLTMVIPFLTVQFEKLVSKLSGIVQPGGNNQSSGFFGGLVTGLSLGLVWAPCAGPILASIAALAATGRVSFEVILVTIAYVTGVGIPLFAFAYGGQQLLTRTRAISPYTPRIQQIFGVIMIITAFGIYSNYDKVIQAKLLETFPQFDQALTTFESNSAITEQLNKLKGQTSTIAIDDSDLFNTNTPAPEFTGITKWLNPEQALTIESLKGKVVLVDFWTYTCINCIRTLPYVTSWYDKYKDKGFVVVGVHTPEFAFEKDTNNVLKAIDQFKIHYPVAQDNDYQTWDAYSNRYWPAEYLIDSKGTIRRVHFGEGEYDKMEEAIQLLLKEAGAQVDSDKVQITEQTPRSEQSPETYLGSKRMLYLIPGGKAKSGQQTFQMQPEVPLNKFSFGGTWNVMDEYSTAVSNATLKYRFTAGKVFLVMKPGQTPGQVKVLVDGKLADETNAGADVKDGVVTVDTDRLYTLVDLKNNPGEHTLELKYDNSGIQSFAFTFGS